MKSPFFLSLIFSALVSNTTLAVESNTNESKNNSTGDTVSHVDTSGNTDADTTQTVSQNKNSETAKASLQQAKPLHTDYEEPVISDYQQWRQQMDERHRQAQQAQLEAYKRFLKERKAQQSSYLPPEIQSRRDEQLKQIEQRQQLMEHMREQHRKEADERRELMRQKMHRTETQQQPEKPSTKAV